MPDVSLDSFNEAPVDDRLHNTLRDCCASETWIVAVADGRPYPDEAALLRVSDEATAALDEVGIAEALAVHPRIGGRASGGWSAQEQAGMSDADATLRERLEDANRRYEARFGQVYLVNATGRSAQELLDLCLARLQNTKGVEQDVVRDELAAINRVRLGKLLTAAAL